MALRKDLNLFHKRSDSQPGTQFPYRGDEPSLEAIQNRRTRRKHV